MPVREIATAIGEGLGGPVVSLDADASAEHFGWLERVARRDVSASSDATRKALGWRPRETASFLADLAVAASTRFVRS